MFDVPASLLASTLVAMEISVSGLMKLGDYPSELLEKVAACTCTCIAIHVVSTEYILQLTIDTENCFCMFIQVVIDLQQKPKSGSTSLSPAVAENCLYIIANVSCKVSQLHVHRCMVAQYLPILNINVYHNNIVFAAALSI
jgi:hypothetical protein